ncbi:hypothetical protein LTS10_013132 [Elasticomyces elasticus]|nr:hypothetical protein LTS10_013132 [Elasticomyces elasticus]
MGTPQRRNRQRLPVTAAGEEYLTGIPQYAAAATQGPLEKRLEAFEALINEHVGLPTRTSGSGNAVATTHSGSPPRCDAPSPDSRGDGQFSHLPAHRPTSTAGSPSPIHASRLPTGAQASTHHFDDPGRSSIVTPSGHFATSGALLLHSRVRALVGYYPSNLFTTLETQRALTPELASLLDVGPPRDRICIDVHAIDSLRAAYITEVHTHHSVAAERHGWDLP